MNQQDDGILVWLAMTTNELLQRLRRASLKGLSQTELARIQYCGSAFANGVSDLMLRIGSVKVDSFESRDGLHYFLRIGSSSLLQFLVRQAVSISSRLAHVTPERQFLVSQRTRLLSSVCWRRQIQCLQLWRYTLPLREQFRSLQPSIEKQEFQPEFCRSFWHESLRLTQGKGPRWYDGSTYVG